MEGIRHAHRLVATALVARALVVHVEEAHTAVLAADIRVAVEVHVAEAAVDEVVA